VSRRALYVVAAAATAALLIALAVDVLLPGYHRTGANGRIRNVAVIMVPGARICQPDQPIEAGTGRVRLYARGLEPTTGPLDVTVESGGRVLGRGSVPRMHVPETEKQVVARLDRTQQRLPAATVCVTNRGAGFAILGQPSAVATAAATAPPGARQPAKFVLLNFDFQLAHKKSWLSFSPTVSGRYGLVKATFFGSWTFWLAMAALLVVAIGSIWWTARTVAR
jgi:hypothetical protein